MKILHLLGSSSSDFYFHCSIMYTRSLMVSEYPSVVNNTNIFAAIHVDGLWSFPESLYEDMEFIKKYSFEDALQIVKTLNVDMMVQHMQCVDKFRYSALFEILHIPYIGSDSHVSANIVDKGITRAILLQAGIPVPAGAVKLQCDDAVEYTGKFPAVVKPTRMENSVGVEIVHDKEEMESALERAYQYGDTAVIDEFIPGREVRCGAVSMKKGDVKPLGCIEYKIDMDKIRTYEDKLEGDTKTLKQSPSTTSWFIDESEEPEVVKKLQEIAVRIHYVMKCRDFSQFDARVTESGDVYVLEVNSFCSFGPLSLIPKIAKHVGISYENLYEGMLEKAKQRIIHKKEISKEDREENVIGA